MPRPRRRRHFCHGRQSGNMECGRPCRCVRHACARMGAGHEGGRARRSAGGGTRIRRRPPPLVGLAASGRTDRASAPGVAGSWCCRGSRGQQRGRPDPCCGDLARGRRYRAGPPGRREHPRRQPRRELAPPHPDQRRGRRPDPCRCPRQGLGVARGGTGDAGRREVASGD